MDEVSLFVDRLDTVGAEYMITGATAAILYGPPRVTNDLDVVLDLGVGQIDSFRRAFPVEHFYLPPDSVIRVEQHRVQRGHFNIIHLASGYNADIYLAGRDPLHAWAFGRRRRIEWGEGESLMVAPPEYVVLRKLEFSREGGSDKHLADVAAMLSATPMDEPALERWLDELGLRPQWERANSWRSS